MVQITIIVHISHKFEDAALTFRELFYKRWRDCPYKVVFITDAPFGENWPGEIITRDTADSLTYSLYKVAQNYKSDYYICLLGDAFLEKTVDTKQVEQLLQEFASQKIQYCNLYRKNYSTSRIQYEQIKKCERYGIAFVSFIASFDFIVQEFANPLNSDYSFEVKYLEEAAKYWGTKEKYENYVRVINSPIRILHGVQKGKWIRKTRNLLYGESIYIRTSKRKVVGWIETVYIYISEVFLGFLSPGLRRRIKGIFKKIGVNISTES